MKLYFYIMLSNSKKKEREKVRVLLTLDNVIINNFKNWFNLNIKKLYIG